jgi:protein TonB
MNFTRGLVPSFDSQLAALAGAISLHAGLMAWALMPSAPVVIQQQVIRIAMVAPSSVAESVAKPQAQEEILPVTPPKDNGLKKQMQKMPKPKQESVEEMAEHNSKLSPTSGKQSPDSTQKQAAITEPVFNAAYLNNPTPSYPDYARRHGVQGKTMLQVQVTTEGSARDISVLHSSGSDALDEAALDAVKRWRFVPARRGDEIVEAKVIVPVEFKLN